MEWRVVLTLLVTVVCYIGFGGFLFFVIEAGNEQRLREESIQRNKVFLRDYPCVSESDFWYLVERVITEYEKGVLALNNRSVSTNWDVISSAYFATTVLTTIGYGHISPLTTTGRIFLVFYALLGIPLTMLLLGGLGGRLARLKSTSRAGAFLMAAIIWIIGVILFVLLPAVMFWKVEGWSYTDSLYFGFITMSTIGFGDLVPGQGVAASTLGWYRLVVAGWILVGLIWLSTAFSMLGLAIKGGHKAKKKPPKDDRPVVMVRSEVPPTPLERLEMADVRRRSTVQMSSADADALRDHVQDALVARAYQEMAAQVVKEMTTMDGTSTPALTSAMTSAVTAAALSPPLPTPAPRAALPEEGRPTTSEKQTKADDNRTS